MTVFQKVQICHCLNFGPVRSGCKRFCLKSLGSLLGREIILAQTLTCWCTCWKVKILNRGFLQSSSNGVALLGRWEPEIEFFLNLLIENWFLKVDHMPTPDRGDYRTQKGTVWRRGAVHCSQLHGHLDMQPKLVQFWCSQLQNTVDCSQCNPTYNMDPSFLRPTLQTHTHFYTRRHRNNQQQNNEQHRWRTQKDWWQVAFVGRNALDGI
jgi:hypothetical protein